MKMRRYLAGWGCVMLLGSLTACSSLFPATDAPATTSTTASTTTTRAERTTTALPATGYIHDHATVLRSGAGLAYKAVENGGLAVGTEVSIISRLGDWYEVQCGEVTGYVSGQFLRFTPWDPQATDEPTTKTVENTEATDDAAVTEADDL